MLCIIDNKKAIPIGIAFIVFVNETIMLLL